jgi:hypothetical protein
MSLNPSDKRLSHSVPGVFIIGGIVAGLLVVSVLLFHLAQVPPLLIAFVAGILAGLTIHLIKDSCTRKGFSPLFPFCVMKISGSIRPCDRTDTRIPKYLFHHCSMTVVIFILVFEVVWSQTTLVLLNLIALSSCLVMMVWFSNVHVEKCCFLSENSRPSYSAPDLITIDS